MPQMPHFEKLSFCSGGNLYMRHNPFYTKYHFISILSGAYQQLFSKYFAAVLIGVVRTLSDLSDGAICERSYDKKTLLPLKFYGFLMISERGWGEG